MSPSRSSWPRWARALTSPWLVSPVLVIALIAGVFVGYGAWTRSQPTHYSRGGGFAPVAGASSGPGSPAPALSGPPPSVAPTTSGGKVVASTSPTAGGQRGGAGAVTGSSTSGGRVASSSSSASGPTIPHVGTYSLDVSGSEQVRFGPFSACTNSFPTSSSLVISHATGEPGASYNFDQRFYPDTANKHDERHIYRYAANSVVLSFEEATVTCSGIKQSTTVNYSPAQTRVALPLSVGATWHSHGGDSSRTEDTSAKIVGTAKLNVAGHSYLTYVIDTHVDMSGSESGTRDQRWWWAPALGIPLKWHEALSGSRSGATYSGDVTCTVVKLP